VSRRVLRERTVLVSGAAGGLGTALCQRFANAGARIAALDRDEQGLHALARGLRAQGAQVLALPADVTDPGHCLKAVQAACYGFGGIDVLVNNAGISHRSLLADTDPAVIRRVMEVNFFGALHLTHAALPGLLARRGAIVAVSSVAGFGPLTGRTGYCASKHALHGFFDSLRSEIEADGVDVMLVCPSFIRTGIGAAASGGDGAAVHTPRLTTGGESSPEQVARAIVDALVRRRRLLLPDATARKAWWLSRFAPGVYARIMRRRLGAEFASRHAE
jgi:NAD(P)-dependent dehydrogenase (short-subunit alcohol dehydrogenase family)